ncbi:hypothetical protein J7M00_06305 [bacterium]|nr:hypothetical protein [bacterium]
MKWVSSILLILLFAGLVFATDSGKSGSTGLLRTTVNQPATDEKTHQAGKLFFTVSNWGFFGSQRGEDDPRYCIIADEEICGRSSGNCRPSAEYPGCSGIEYLFQGALWIGAVISGDTLVSIGEDGWETGINELLPSYNYDDTLSYRSILDPEKYPDAISEEDYVGNFTDTVQNPAFVDPSHRPIGISVHQESYAWSYDYAKNFVIIDYTLSNVREDGRTIEDLFVGIYIDGDCGHVETSDYAQDDITGFIKNYIDETTFPPDTIPIMLAWIADNDGDPEDGVFTDRSPTGAMACRVLRGPWGTKIDPDSTQFSYNWWISNIDETYDWGPGRTGTDCTEDGTPMGDRNKYLVMSNGEFDYDQTSLPDSATASDWQGFPPPSDQSWLDNLANGYDTRFLLSFGPLTLAPAESTHITIAFLVGENFHQDPQNTESAWTPDKFNFDDLAYAAYWVALVFDNPGVDTDPDDTIPPPPSDEGDGVPDYRGPTPPPAPDVHIELGEYKVTIYWRGDDIENTVDQITGIHDFEGYRIYVGEANLDQYYTPLVQFDKVDYLRYKSVVRIFDSLDTGGDSVFHYLGMYDDTAYAEDTSYSVVVISPGGDTLGTALYNPEPIAENLGMPPTVTKQFEGDNEPKEYYYYTIENLLPGNDFYVVVSSFDFGQPSKNLSSLESSKTKYAKWVVPSGKAAEDNKVRVFPNPYRVDHDYSDFWEKSLTSEWTEYSRKLRFFNLPAKCKVRIYTLDGDLVKELDHDDSGEGEMVGAEDWNLISRNDQSIASGIYIFSVEDLETGEIQTGKFVIIK